MRIEDSPHTGFTDSDLVLISEAIRRACLRHCNAGLDQALIAEAVVAEARRGTRTMYGLVKVGWRVGETRD